MDKKLSCYTMEQHKTPGQGPKLGVTDISRFWRDIYELFTRGESLWSQLSTEYNISGIGFQNPEILGSLCCCWYAVYQNDPKARRQKKCPKAANFRRISGPVVLYGPLVPPLATLGAPGTSRCPHQLAVYVLFNNTTLGVKPPGLWRSPLL